VLKKGGKEGWGDLMKKLLLILLALILALSSVSFAAAPAPGDRGAFVLASTSFEDGKRMPDKHRYRGENKSPALRWQNAPAGTQSFLITCIDNDAALVTGKPWLHWQIANIPAAYRSLPEGVPQAKSWKDGIVQAKNDAGDYGWSGPYSGNEVHNYEFVIYALDVAAPLSADPNYIKRHTLATAKLVGVSGD
jgi:Raf kinase inhibitor-like YbhB/YbcL family protein